MLRVKHRSLTGESEAIKYIYFLLCVPTLILKQGKAYKKIIASVGSNIFGAVVFDAMRKLRHKWNLLPHDINSTFLQHWQVQVVLLKQDFPVIGFTLHLTFSLIGLFVKGLNLKAIPQDQEGRKQSRELREKKIRKQCIHFSLNVYRIYIHFHTLLFSLKVVITIYHIITTHHNTTLDLYT